MLRDVTAEDVPIFYEHQCDPQATQMAGFPSRMWEPFRTHWTRILSDDSVRKQTIVVEGRVAGNIVSFEQDGIREVGYWIGREFWGRGVATEALSLFLKQEPTRPLYAHVAKHNAGSLRVLEKCDFVSHAEDEDAVTLVRAQ